jgi:hypothetical protein
LRGFARSQGSEPVLPVHNVDASTYCIFNLENAQNVTRTC